MPVESNIWSKKGIVKITVPLYVIMKSTKGC
jgi:hypothetical protein